ncbi:MAG: glycosyltransferase [Pirellulales bacterium]|nr:glycosyltransferase [Pirellulales bacterium]
MVAPPEISVIVSTYQRPGHLRRCLASLAVQQGVAGRFEAIVVDDGSLDETADVVDQFRREGAFRLKFCTHPHDGFQLARCRNAGIRSSLAPYLLFTDGDCIFPPDHLQRHLEARRHGVVRAGDCIRLDESTSRQIDEQAVRSGGFLAMVAPLRKSLRKTYLKSLAYQLMRHGSRPKLIGWNMAAWREQLERINGFDEQFRGWGCEDDDLAARLRKIGARVATALGYTQAYHLWHPPHATTPGRWQDGPNVAYFKRPLVLARCLEGIRSRSLSQVSTRIAETDQPELARRLRAVFHESAVGPELELLVWPSTARFSTNSACRVIIAPAAALIPTAMVRAAHSVVRYDAATGAAGAIEALRGALQAGGAGSAPPAATRDAA